MQHERGESSQSPALQQGQQETQTKPETPSAQAHGESAKRRWWNIWKRWEKDEADWWFASTGIPLLAATLGPLANVSSIAALVTPWRQQNIVNGQVLSDFDGVPFDDPRWCYWINVASLICGFLGNIFLLLNFTQRIRYVIALPATVILWYLSSGLLIAITICINEYAPPIRPEQTYTQGFWYAVAAASFYTICSMILMVNMLGYFLGHYPENFALSDSQRTLILQTMTFFIWLAGGAAIFSDLEQSAGNVSWGFADALYFCDVTILTVGFGDMVPSTNVTRGLVFPYSVGGIITLALIVSSLYTAVRELGGAKIVQKHIDRLRESVVERTVTNSFDLRHREHHAHHLIRKRKLGFPKISAPTEPRPFRKPMDGTVYRVSALPRVSHALGITSSTRKLVMKEEKDRFEVMRKIQADTKRFKQWMALLWSTTTFLILWCVGAVVFSITERESDQMTYFHALYFCYISLLTIGYGDLTPKTNPGRCFFVVWSLIAVPTMTILISNLGDTVVANFKKWSDNLADFTVLPKAGVWRSFLDKHPWLLAWLQRWTEERARKRRLKKGFEVADIRPENGSSGSSSLENNGAGGHEDPENQQESETPGADAEATPEVSLSQPPTSTSISRQLAHCIQKVSFDLRSPQKRYSYEEWVEFTRLIRATHPERLDSYLGVSCNTADDENEEGLVSWDWLGEDSPLVSGSSESEWLMERLVESLVRLEKRKEVARRRLDIGALRGMDRRDGDGDVEKRGEHGGAGDGITIQNVN